MSLGPAILAAVFWDVLDEVIDRAATPAEKPKPWRWCQHVEGLNRGQWRRPRSGPRKLRRRRWDS